MAVFENFREHLQHFRLFGEVSFFKICGQYTGISGGQYHIWKQCKHLILPRYITVIVPGLVFVIIMIERQNIFQAGQVVIFIFSCGFVCVIQAEYMIHPCLYAAVAAHGKDTRQEICLRLEQHADMSFRLVCLIRSHIHQGRTDGVTSF